MKKTKEEIKEILKLEFPEIFRKEGDISILLLSRTLTLLNSELEENDKNEIFTKNVLIEKSGNIISKKFRLLKLFNQLSNY